MIRPEVAAVIPIERIEQAIFLIRGHKVMLDADLARLYSVETKNLNKAVKRNLGRFPEDFMFQLTPEETTNLRFQFGTSRSGWGGLRHRPFVFTEQGVAMLSGVLQSKRAVAVNVAIMRTSVRMRQLIETSSVLARRLDELEKKYDMQFQIVFNIIQKMAAPPKSKRRKIGS